MSEYKRKGPRSGAKPIGNGRVVRADWRKEISKELKKRWKDPEYRAMKVKEVTENWQKPEYREQQVMVNGPMTPEVKQKYTLKKAQKIEEKARRVRNRARGCLEQAARLEYQALLMKEGGEPLSMPRGAALRSQKPMEEAPDAPKDIQ